jgi:hypothetical protein
MPATPDLSHLDDHTILLIFGYLTQELREELPEADLDTVQTSLEARQVIGQAATTLAGEPPVAIPDLAESRDAARAARQIIMLLYQDPALRGRIDALIADPPRDEQMTVELAIAGAIVLGLVVSWLQTNVDISYSDKDGKKDFQIHIKKSAAKPELIKDIAGQVVQVFTTYGGK